jgi:hypothetical protein
MDGRAAFASNAVEFIRMLPDNAKLLIRTTRSDGKTKDTPRDHPVESVDHSEHR